MNSHYIFIDSLRLFWRHRIAVGCLVIAASVILTLGTTAREPKVQLVYNLVVNPEVARPANVFQMIGDFPEVRAHADDDDGDGYMWRVNTRKKSVHIPGVNSANEMQYKKVIEAALQHALLRLNTFSLDVIETSELARSETTGNANEFSQAVLRAKLFNRYFQNDQKMIAYFNIDAKEGFILPAWVLMLLYLPLCFGIVAFGLLGWAAWRHKMPELLVFLKTEIANDKV